MVQTQAVGMVAVGLAISEVGLTCNNQTNKNKNCQQKYILKKKGVVKKVEQI